MKAGYFSPMPPAPTGVADYSAALLPHLQALGPVELAPQQCDVALYHLGNNSLHREIYCSALQRPGVAVLHDAVLQHFFLGMLTQDEYVQEFAYNYGEWSRDLGRELWRERARSGADARYFAYPMLKRIASISRSLVVHNPCAAEIARRHAPEAAISEIPHLFIQPQLPDPVDTLRFRASLGVQPRTLLVGAFGHQRETKRLPVLIRAFRRASQSGADIRLLISGAFVSGTFARAIEPLLDHPGILRTGHLPETELWRYAAAIDLCVNLRYPSAAETSGIAIRMMGIGKPVIFTRDAAIARIPENACLRVDPGDVEEETLAEYLIWLARDREAAQQIGLNAASHIRQHHSPDAVARRYWQALMAAL